MDRLLAEIGFFVRIFLLLLALRLLWDAGVWLNEHEPILFGALLSAGGVIFVFVSTQLFLKFVLGRL
ncbi:hypothetical protein D3C84_324760 [compost metagenome]